MDLITDNWLFLLLVAAFAGLHLLGHRHGRLRREVHPEHRDHHVKSGCH
jgi:hypothetical protein